ncbi:MAG: glycosyltransferase [Planctomycetota bacterium]
MPPRILAFTTLYPNPRAPFDGLFVRARLEAMARHAPVHALIPVLWRPGSSPTANNGFYRSVHRHDQLAVSYRRFFNVPRYGKRWDARLMAASVRRTFRELVAQVQPDVIDAHWGYPDGVAAAILARECGVPYAITVRGDDLNVFLDTPARSGQIVDALQGAHRVIGVCADLTRTAESVGVDPKRTAVVPNGVDADLFRPVERDVARSDLGIDADTPLIVSVGRLSREKGYELIFDAMARLDGSGGPRTHLAIVGKRGKDRAYEDELEVQARALGLQDRVHLPGPAPQADLSKWFSAADVSCLASTREGWPNVILESLASGCPVVAARVGGVPEVLTDPAVGLVFDRTVADLTSALQSALTATWDRNRIRTYAEERSWDECARRCIDVLR